VAIAGRSQPFKRESNKVAAVIWAPVLPAEIMASASPFLTRSVATQIELSFFFSRLRTSSSIAITEPHETNLTFAGKADSWATASGKPTIISSSWGEEPARAKTPSIMAAGALSPPIISKAILINFLPTKLLSQRIILAIFPGEKLLYKTINYTLLLVNRQLI